MTNTFVNGKVHVRKRMCATCIFRPGNLAGLKPGRVEQMVNEAVEDQSCIPCHHHLYQGEAIEPVCRGFYDRHATQPLQIAERLGLMEFVEDER
jgi:hypothetical protein